MADPTTVSELIDWFENNFECFTGQPRAFFEIPLGPEFSYDGKPNAVFRGVYQTHAIRTKDEANAEQNLVKAMYADFAQFGGAGHALFWRLPEKITFLRRIVQKFGRHIATEEEVESGVTLPLGCVHDVEAGIWREADHDSWEWVLRTRLYTTAMNCMPTGAFITRKAEGAVALAI